MPTLKAAGHTVRPIWTVRKHAFIDAAIDGQTAVWVLEAIGHVEYIARIYLTPNNV